MVTSPFSLSLLSPEVGTRTDDAHTLQEVMAVDKGAQGCSGGQGEDEENGLGVNMTWIEKPVTTFNFIQPLLSLSNDFFPPV